MDLMALADALLLPDDDLALASVLKSPLFGLDRGAAVRARLGPQGHAARGAAREGATTCEFMRRARAARALRRVGAARSPFAFYARVLGAERRPRALLRAARAGGRRRARRIPQSRARLRARARRRRCRASSPGCAPATREVKRDMEIARDEVRVMTVHGAKGLEAPIVILADTTTPPKGPQRAAAAARCRSRMPRPARRTGSCGPGARPTTSRRSRRRARARVARAPRTNTAGCSMWR